MIIYLLFNLIQLDSTMKKILYFVTGNSGKFHDASKIFQNHKYQLVQYNLDLPEYQGTSHEVVFKKCHEAEHMIPSDIYPYIIEDTSLIFNCLNGLPGPYIKDFYKMLGLQGLYKLTEPYTNKKAHVLSILLLKMSKNTKPIMFTGFVNGLVVQPRGDKNYGWSPIFEINSPQHNIVGNTFAEVDDDTTVVPHREIVFSAVAKFLID